MTTTDIETPDAEARRPLHAWLWPGEWREAVARWVIGLLVGSVAVTALYLHPWLNAIVVAVSGLVVLAARRRAAGEKPDEEADVDEDEEERALPEAADMVDILRELGTGTGVLLTALRDQLLHEFPGYAWTTKDVRVLLAEAGVRVRGVRVAGAGNGPGVHREDVPAPLSPAPSDAPVGVVAAGQNANTNTNNVTVVRSAEGAQITVTPASSRP